MALVFSVKSDPCKSCPKASFTQRENLSTIHAGSLRVLFIPKIQRGRNELRRIFASIVLCLLLMPILTAQVVAARKDGGTSGRAFSAQTFTSTNVPIAIPDFDQAGITSTVNVPSLTVVDVNLILEDLEHTCVRDLRIELTSPAGRKVTLVKSTALPAAYGLRRSPDARPWGSSTPAVGRS